MSRTLLISGLAAATLAAVAGAATAQQPARPALERQAHAQRADTDGDGRISRAEFVARRVERLTAADADGDGTVTREELQVRGDAHRAQRAETRFARLDANGDGAVSREEFTAPRAARADGAPRPMRAQGGPDRQGPRMARRGAGRGPIVIAEVQTKTEQAFTRLDADNDGFVTAAEARAGRQQMREHRHERRAERRAAREASRPVPASE
jgi:Ca2+-binding EF-hand superfamily protein